MVCVQVKGDVEGGETRSHLSRLKISVVKGMSNGNIGFTGIILKGCTFIPFLSNFCVNNKKTLSGYFKGLW